MNQLHNKPPSRMVKSTTTTYKVVALLITITLLIYIHDAFPKNIGKIGLSSVRVYLYTVMAEIRFLALLFLFYWSQKGKPWRFVIWLPIIMTTYQAIIRLFALQKTAYNEFDTKLALTVIVFVILIIYYFKKKKNEL